MVFDNAGLPEYGCYISSEKRLTNFDISLEGSPFVGAAHKKGQLGLALSYDIVG